MDCNVLANWSKKNLICWPVSSQKGDLLGRFHCIMLFIDAVCNSAFNPMCFKFRALNDAVLL